MAMPPNIYPVFTVKHIQNPNRLYAIPLLGGLFKLVILIPQYIMIFFVVIAFLLVTIFINPFVVLFTGKYWSIAHSLTVSYASLLTKIMLYLFGLTDKYPGFNFRANEDFTLDIPCPQTPNRLFAVPFFGGLARYVLLIPFIIFMTVLEFASGIAMVGSSFVVLFTGKYPESAYELSRDYVRTIISYLMYFFGLSDSYPSFWISMNHKNIKIALIALGAIFYISYQLMSIGINLFANSLLNSTNKSQPVAESTYQPETTK